MNGMRDSLKEYAKKILFVKQTCSTSPVNDGEDRGEELANLTLAYRHMEDCIMRLGKVIQAYQGGKSIYDKPADNLVWYGPHECQRGCKVMIVKAGNGAPEDMQFNFVHDSQYPNHKWVKHVCK